MSAPEADSVLRIGTPEEIKHAAQLVCEGLVVYDNGPVFALVGDAKDAELQTKIQAAKGEGRGGAQPVGCTMPFDHPLLEGIYETRHVSNKAVRELLEDPDTLTERIGGLAFMRGSANLTLKKERGIPNSVIPPPPEKSADATTSTIQIWSPAGNVATEQLLQAAIERGAITVMSSANKTDAPEIITEAQARRYAAEMGLPLVITQPEAQKPQRPRASYLTYGVDSTRINIIRLGCLDEEIARLLLDGIPVALDPGRKQPDPKYPEHVLRLEDLRTRRRLSFRYRTARGAELRKRVLEFAHLDKPPSY